MTIAVPDAYKLHHVLRRTYEESLVHTMPKAERNKIARFRLKTGRDPPPSHGCTIRGIWSRRVPDRI